MKKGDTLIWHPLLPHGGASIRDPGRSRKSIVFHYLPEATPISGLEAFFSAEPVRGLPTYRDRAGRLYMDHGGAKFAPNY